MDRKTFMNELSRLLTGISEEEKRDILFDYDEHFTIGIEGGRTETEIVAALGDPRKIAKQLRASYMIEKAETTKSAGNILRAVLAAMGLGFFNLVFVLGLFLGLIGVLLGIFGTAIGFMVGGVGAFLAPFIGVFFPQYINSNIHPITCLSLGVALAGLGLLIFIGGGYLTKWLYIATVKYLKCNIRIIKGEMNYER